MSALIAAWAIAKRIFGLFPLKDWLIVGALLLVVLYHLYSNHESYVSGFDAGAKAASAKCEAKEKAAKADYDRRAKEAEDAKKAQEQAQATELAVQGANYEKALQDSQDQRARDVAAARSGALKLRVAGMCTGTAAGGAAAEAPTASAGRDGAEGAELPKPLAGSLLGLADDADAIVHQLTACQAVINTYQKGPS